MTENQFNFLFNQAKELMAKTRDPVHDWSHIERVLTNVFQIKKLLPIEKQNRLDDKILTIAAAWHDICYVFYKPSIWQYFLEGKRCAKICR